MNVIATVFLFILFAHVYCQEEICMLINPNYYLVIGRNCTECAGLTCARLSRSTNVYCYNNATYVVFLNLITGREIGIHRGAVSEALSNNGRICALSPGNIVTYFYCPNNSTCPVPFNEQAKCGNNQTVIHTFAVPVINSGTKIFTDIALGTALPFCFVRLSY